jgi:predicted DNA-binding transcriptional regulator AlpA
MTTSNCRNLLFELESAIRLLEIENATLKEKVLHLEQQRTHSDMVIKNVQWVEMESGKRFLSKKELGKYLGVSAGTISNQMSKGTFPIRPKKMGRHVRFDMKEILEYLRTDEPFWERDRKLK